MVASIEPADVARFRVVQVHRPDLRHMSRCCRARFRLEAGSTWVCRKCGSPFEGGKLVSRATVNRLFWAMAAFGVWSIERRYHLANPWSVESFAEDAVPPPSVTEKDLAAIFKALEHRAQSTFPWRALFELARETGLRRSELGRLARVDIEEDELRAWVVSSHRRGQNKGRRLRSVALTSRALAILQELPKREDGLIFGRIPDTRRAFASAAEGAGLERVWLHLMRHVGATETGRVGASLADLMAFGGWASPRMAQRYSHSDHRRQLEIAKRREEARTEAARRDAVQAAVNPSPRPESETGGGDSSPPPVSTVDPTRIELVTS